MKNPARLVPLMLLAAFVFPAIGCSSAKLSGATPPPSSSAPRPAEPGGSGAVLEEIAGEYGGSAEQSVADPLRYWNLAWFHFNDKLFFWLVKPVSSGYGFAVPKTGRRGVHNFIQNLGFPGRFLNCGLQGRIQGSGNELLRFCVNLTVGVLGFWDAATDLCHLKSYDADFDQTLGKWKLGMGIYLVWPFFGPSSVRGTIGIAGDSVLNPIYSETAVSALRMINDTSLDLNPYESLVKIAVEPYVAVRNAYVQNRRHSVSE